MTCLFAASGKDLKTPLRAGASDDELRELMHMVWSRRTDRYSEERAEKLSPPAAPEERGRIEMYRIGG